MERLLEDAEAIKAKNGEVVEYSIDSFADIVEAIHVIQEEAGITGTTVNEGSTTIEGAINKVKAAWENWLVAAANGNEDIAEKTQVLGETLGNAAGLIIPRVAEVLSSLLQMVSEKAPEIWDQFKTAMMEALPDEWREKVIEFERSFLGFIDTIQLVGSALSLVGEAFSTVAELATFLGELVEPVISSIDGVLAPLMDTATSMIETLRTGFLPIIEQLIGLAGRIVEAISNVIGAILPLIGPLMQIVTISTQVILAVTSIMSNGTALIAEFIEPFIKTVTDFLKPAMEFLGEKVNHLQGAIGKLSEAFGKALEKISPLMEPLGRLAGVLSGPVMTGISIVIDIIGVAIGVFATLIGWVADVIEWIGSAGDVFEDVAKTIGGAVDLMVGFFNDLVRGASSTAQGIIDFFKSIPEMIMNFFSNAGEWLVNAGKNIIIGFWNGLVEAWNGVADWIGGIGQWIVDNKGPEQYDKNLLVPAGKWIMGGLRGGLEQAFEREVQPYVESMASAIEDSFGNPQLSPYAAAMTHNTSTMAAQPQQQPTNVTAILELDRVQFGKLVFQLNGDETQRIGVDLVGGYA